MSKACLILKDGTFQVGEPFGYPAPYARELDPGLILQKSVGELVFNTGMCGYHEILTDPSYTGQIVMMTYPHGGNYGDLDDWSEIGPEGGVKRPGVKCAGFVLRDLYQGPVPAHRLSLDEFLKRHQTPGISEIDTRFWTLHLRDHGSQNAIIIQLEQESPSKEELRLAQAYLDAYPSMEGCDLTPYVGTEESVEINPQGSPHLVLVDSGIKANIIRELEQRGAHLTLVPDTWTVEQILSLKPDGVLFSNGPGDPAALQEIVRKIQRLIGQTAVLGICLGHQMIAQALGAKTYKMKFGHHGVNHPVRDEFTKRVFVTSQNHGFAVDEASLPAEVQVWFRNANDGTIEGLSHRSLPILCSQFHPESAPGPHDSSWIFNAFIDKVREYQLARS
jgi:carbamoyl-phosphate synthase small subunit